MGHTVLKDLLVSLGRAADYIEGCVPVNLWRAQDTRQLKTHPHPMDFIEEPYVLPDGRRREADITITPGPEGIPWVRVQKLPAGLSNWDRRGVFRNKAWLYFRIPKGTQLPDGLALIKDHFSELYQATHYTIAPVREMPLSEFKHLLRELFAQMQKDVG